MIEEIKQYVEKEMEDGMYKYHIALVLKYSKVLAKIMKVNEEEIEISALLHDIGKAKYGKKDHHITGRDEAEKILKKFNLPKEYIERIKHNIESHSHKDGFKPKTIEAEIIANADAMSHLDVFPRFIYITSQELDFEKTLEWIDKKIERSWNKITLKEAKELSEEKYKAIKLIINSNKQIKNYEN